MNRKQRNRLYSNPLNTQYLGKRDWTDRLFDNFGKIAAVWITLGILFWGTVIFVAIHFLAKVW